MTTVDRTDATDEEFRARFDRFGIFDEERVVEEVARAMFRVTNPADDWTAEFPDHIRDWCRRLAAAAVTAYRGAAS